MPGALDEPFMPNLGLPDMGLLGADVDFDLADFEIIGEGPLLGGEPQEHILKPKIAEKDITHALCFENAQAFARQVDLTPGSRTYAWVNGSFIFGDVIEALWTRGCDIDELYICSLSLSLENIDSLYNVLTYSNLRTLNIVLSGFFYSHEKNKLVKYMYKKLDDPRVQIAFGAYHGKIFTFSTHKGNYLTCHGSANLRSSNSIEQICFETSRDLFEFNAGIIREICDKYGTINHSYHHQRHYHGRLDNNESWECVLRSSRHKANADAKEA